VLGINTARNEFLLRHQKFSLGIEIEAIKVALVERGGTKDSLGLIKVHQAAFPQSDNDGAPTRRGKVTGLGIKNRKVRNPLGRDSADILVDKPGFLVLNVLKLFRRRLVLE
jgi:hypothetical protein